MARNKLTDTQIKSARPGWHGDGDGLWLRVKPDGNRSWVFVSVRHGRRREMGLGAYGRGVRDVSLSAARAKADEVRAILGRGGDPFKELPERLASIKPRTFGAVADELLETMMPTFKNAKHAAQWKMTLAEYAKPLRKIPIAEVSTDDVVRVLRPIWGTKPETATRLRGRIEKVLDRGKALGLRQGENPARWRGHLDHILGKPDKLRRGHHAAMPYDAIPGFMALVRAAPGFGPRALELTILTACRTSEVIGAKWDEFDWDAKIWTIPAARMKAGRPHQVPLTDRMIAILKDCADKRLNDFVFPGKRPQRPMSNMAMNMFMRREGAGHFTVHGFRSSFRDWAGDRTAFARDIAEMALAHKVGDAVELAYRRSSALEKRRKLMEAWEAFCAKDADNVVPLRGGQ